MSGVEPASVPCACSPWELHAQFVALLCAASGSPAHLFLLHSYSLISILRQFLAFALQQSFPPFCLVLL
jgi:hypothetical protein